MASITELPYTFNVEKIQFDIQERVFSDPVWNEERWNKLNQFSLRETSDWFEGVGSLYDYDTKTWTNATSNFKAPCTKIAGTYLDHVIKVVEELGQEENVKIGRVRVMRLRPKTCLTLHKDTDEFRFHIPLQTSLKSFFVEGGIVERMPVVGRLYRFKTNNWHTAVNASTEDRTHIVFDTYV
jgi:hypothetical protein